jgi:hypothetical protein
MSNSKQGKKYKFDMDIMKTLNNLVENISRHSPIYQKQKFWICISKILVQSDLQEEFSKFQQCSIDRIFKIVQFLSL